MKLTIERSELLRALAHVTGVVERRSTIPILSNVLLAADGNELKLTATDLDIEIVEKVPAMVEQAGGTTVQAIVFHDIVRKLPDGAQLQLAREGEDGQMTVVSGNSRFALQALTAGNFPSLEAEEFSNSFQLQAKDIKRLIEKTRFAVSTEETRYYLNGIFMHTTEGQDGVVLRAVATDGHRLAQCEMPAPGGAEGMPGIIVPRKTVNELHRLVEDVVSKTRDPHDDDKILIEVSDAKFRFSTGSVVLTSKLIDGTFPDYQRVIPEGNDKVVNVLNSDFSGAVDRVSTLSMDKGRAVKLNITPDRLQLSVNNPDSGSAEEEIPVEYEGEPLEVGFNARYLLDISGQLENDSVNFLMADPGSPTIVRDGNDATTLYVLMPMRV